MKPPVKTAGQTLAFDDLLLVKDVQRLLSGPRSESGDRQPWVVISPPRSRFDPKRGRSSMRGGFELEPPSEESDAARGF